MHSQPLVSYCIPSFNHERYVVDCVRDLLAQDYSNVEVIVVDDQSKDGSYAALQGIQDSRLVLRRNPENFGPSETLNRAIALARGEYIGLSGSDDLHRPERTRIEIGFLERNIACGAVFSMPSIIDDDGVEGDWCGARVRFEKPLLAQQTPTRETLFKMLLLSGNCLLAPSAMIRRDLIHRVGQFDPGLIQLQDLDYWLRLLAYAEIAVLGDELVKYRISRRGQNLSSENVSSSNRHHFEMGLILTKIMAQQELKAMWEPDRHAVADAAVSKGSREFLNFAAQILSSDFKDGIDEGNLESYRKYIRLISAHPIFSNASIIDRILLKIRRHF